MRAPQLQLSVPTQQGIRVNGSGGHFSDAQLQAMAQRLFERGAGGDNLLTGREVRALTRTFADEEFGIARMAQGLAERRVMRYDRNGDGAVAQNELGINEMRAMTADMGPGLATALGRFTGLWP
ncbi:MAG: hypothetical protein AAFY60_11320 [Myxococcota bacterium]